MTKEKNKDKKIKEIKINKNKEMLTQVITNITDTTNKISLTKIILLFYIIAASGLLSDLFSGQLLDFLKSRLGLHLLGLVTLFVIIIEHDSEIKLETGLLYTFVGYLIIIFTTKLDLMYSLSILALLFVGYIFEYKMTNKEEKSKLDKSLEEKDILNIKSKNDTTRSIIMWSIILVTVVGSLSYLFKKKIQKGGGFSYETFIYN
jgi:hypothetical protein